MKRFPANTSSHGRGGFTIAELLVAVLITSIIAGIIYASYMGSLKVIQSARSDSEQVNMARFILERITADLRCSFLRGYREWLVFVGLDDGDAGSGDDAVSFIASSHDRPERDAAESKLCEVSYFLDTGGGDSLYLVRREDTTLDDDPFSGGDTRIIGEGVAGLDFEYFDGESWGCCWDSREENELPRAVRVSLTFLSEEKGGAEGEEGETARYTTYSTEVAIPLGGSWEEEDEEEEAAEGEQERQTKISDTKE